ncbi:hypothetical protein ACP70R_031179 [Stipagrostis hirtigluma subsp. patula]
MAMPMVEDNNAAVIGAGARLLRKARENVSSALLAVGFATCATAVRAAGSSPPAEGALRRRVRLGLLAAAAAGGLCAMWAAVWVAADAPRRRKAGQIILCAAFVPFVLAVGLSGSDDPALVFSIFDAMV